MPIDHKKPDESTSPLREAPTTTEELPKFRDWATRTGAPAEGEVTDRAKTNLWTNSETSDAAQPVEPQKTATAPPNADAVRPRRRGFAAMDRDRVKQIASKGGRAAHAAGTAHQFNSDEARIAGKKGGMAPHVRRGGVRRRPVTEPARSPTSQSHEPNHGERDER